MGLTITLYLITFIVYSSISSTMAPPARGFSYIEVWMAGIVSTISVAILEHVFILAFKRMNVFANQDHVKLIDGISFIFTFSFFILFIVIYWLKVCGYFWNIHLSVFLQFTYSMILILHIFSLSSFLDMYQFYIGRFVKVKLTYLGNVHQIHYYCMYFNSKYVCTW